jgi:hypothetical protein
MNNLALSLAAAFTALDGADANDLALAVEALHGLYDAGANDLAVSLAVDTIEREIETRTANLLEDGEAIDDFDAASYAIRKFRLAH